MAGVMDVALGLGTAMHELRDERRAGFVNRLHDGFPAVPVRVGGEPGLVEVALAISGIGIDTLADDHPEAAFGKGCVVVAHQFVGSALGLGADPRHGCDDGSIAQAQVLQ